MSCFYGPIKHDKGIPEESVQAMDQYQHHVGGSA